MEDLYKALAGLTGSERCLNYDACPLGRLLVNIDGYSMKESRLPWMTLEDWGWKAVVAAASDVAASGGVPTAMAYSIGVRDRGDALRIASGVGEASRWLGVEVLKADTNSCGCDAWIDVAVLGEADRPIPRSGARPGDLVFQIGYSGYGLVSRLILEGVISLGDVPRGVVDYTRRPRPPIRMGPLLSRCGASASADNSDGLGYTLWLIAEASRVAVSLEEPLVDPEVESILEGLGYDASMVFESWEDYDIVAAVPPESAGCVEESCRRAGVACRRIGVASRGSGVYYRGGLLRVRGWSWL